MDNSMGMKDEPVLPCDSPSRLREPLVSPPAYTHHLQCQRVLLEQVNGADSLPSCRVLAGASKFYTGSNSISHQISSLCIAYASASFPRPLPCSLCLGHLSSLNFNSKTTLFLTISSHKTVTFPVSFLCFTFFIDELN